MQTQIWQGRLHVQLRDGRYVLIDEWERTCRRDPLEELRWRERIAHLEAAPELLGYSSDGPVVGSSDFGSDGLFRILWWENYANAQWRCVVKVSPFHSKKNPGVYHTCSNCTEGNNIEVGNKKIGKGPGRPRKCSRCKELERKGGC